MKIRYILFLFFYCSAYILPQGFICAVGGGSEDYGSWSDDPYGWIVQKSDSGKILVLSYSDQTNWIPDYFKSLGAFSAQNFKISSKLIADQQSTYDELISAKAIFIKGGDQWKYVNYWKGTKTEEAIRYIYQNGGVVAGTSAGAAILSGIVFTAKFGSAYSEESLIDPFYSKINLDNDFLNLVPNAVFDTHFIERGRFGRLIAFVFNSKINYGKDILGIGLDDRTAFCIDNNNIGRVFGSGAVSIFQKDELTKYEGNSSEYSIENLKCDQLLHGWSFNLESKEIIEYPESAIFLDTTKIINYPESDIWMSGSNSIPINIDHGLKNYFESVDIESVGLIYNESYSQNIEEVRNYFNQHDIQFQSIPISNSLVNESETSSRILNSTCFIIMGNNLNSIAILSDTLSAAGKIFNLKIKKNTPIYAIGNTGKLFGENYIGNTDGEKYASYYGKMTNNSGMRIFADLIFQPMIFGNSDYYENRTSALLLGLMKNQKSIGIYCSGNDFITVNKESKTISQNGDLPLIIVDSRKTSVIDSSHYITRGTLTRQIVGMNNLRYTISNMNKDYSIEEGKLTNLTSIRGKAPIDDEYHLNQNYPNPFNGSTRIRFSITKPSYIKINIYDLAGEEIDLLLNNYLEPGEYQINYNANNTRPLLASGIYFYSLKSNESVETKKMIYLK